MLTNKPYDNLLTEKQKQELIDQIVDFFATERDEEIGIIAATNLLDFFLETIGIPIYNKGVENTQKLLSQKFEELNAQIDLDLKK